MVILNNKCYGMVRQFQESYFESRYQSTYWGYSAPDFTGIARAYGIQSSILDNESQIESALEQLWNDPQSPFLLEVLIPLTTNAYPKIAFGHPITEMEPFNS
jgi:acetolactate synthase-1/2/3 large subunit